MANNPIPQDLDKAYYLPTAQAYDAWSSVYDTDGNFLQALDTQEMKTMLPQALSLIQSAKPWKVIDLGCGTGRNTAALVELEAVEVLGLDASKGMLDVAQKRLGWQPNLKLEIFDMIASPSPLKSTIGADLVVSTLVIEHIPSDLFFRQVSQILRPGGVLLLTNMHEDMGRISQAGFIGEDGKRVRPTSYAHSLVTVQEAAEKEGLVTVGNVVERSVTKDLSEVLGTRSTKWIGVRCWFGGIWKKRS